MVIGEDTINNHLSIRATVWSGYPSKLEIKVVGNLIPTSDGGYWIPMSKDDAFKLAYKLMALASDM